KFKFGNLCKFSEGNYLSRPHHVVGKGLSKQEFLARPCPVVLGRISDFVKGVADLIRKRDGTVSRDCPWRCRPDDDGRAFELQETLISLGCQRRTCLGGPIRPSNSPA